MKECDILGGSKHTPLLHIFRASRPQPPRMYVPDVIDRSAHRLSITIVET